MTNNKILYIIIAIVVLVIIGGVTYWYMQSQNSYTPTSYLNTQDSNTSTNLNTQNNSKPTSALNQNPTTVSVTISNFIFTPKNLTIHKGDTVTWKNNDSMTHTVTGDNGGPSSQYINLDESYSYTFTTTGTFPYHCSIHPSMKAVIQVIN